MASTGPISVLYKKISGNRRVGRCYGRFASPTMGIPVPTRAKPTSPEPEECDYSDGKTDQQFPTVAKIAARLADRSWGVSILGFDAQRLHVFDTLNI